MNKNCWFCRSEIIDGEDIEIHYDHLYHAFCWDNYWEANHINHFTLKGKELHLKNLEDLTKAHEKAFGQYNYGFKVPLILYNSPNGS